MQPKPVVLLSVPDHVDAKAMRTQIESTDCTVISVHVATVALTALATVSVAALVISESYGTQHCNEHIQAALRIRSSLPIIILRQQDDEDSELSYLRSGATWCIAPGEQQQAKMLLYLSKLQKITASTQQSNEIKSIETHALHNYLQAHKLESLRTFAAGMAHECNNTLGIISGSVELLKQQNETSVDHLIEPIQCAIDRGHQLTESIIAFSNQNETSFENIDIVQVVKNSLDILKTSVPEDIKTVFDCNVETALVRGNAAHIHQIIMHLISNAIYAISHHESQEYLGTLHIGVHVHEEVQGPSVRLWVQDNGCGIDPVRVDRICDPFYTSKPSGEGRGMGLDIVNGIVKKHQGSIQVVSNLNQGTCIDIHIPLLSSERPSLGQGRCCLLVDDDELVLEMTSRSLESMGCQCCTASSMDEAIKMFDLGIYNFDVVITDWNMPKGNGAALAQQVRQRDAEMPIILVSGYVHGSIRSELLNYVDAILDKPCSAKHILDCLDYIVEQQRGRSHVDQVSREQTKTF